MANKKIGTCLLSGETGKLVKCHILPQAFTRPAVNGQPLLQSTKGEGHKRRWTSWYDASLVTRTGEDILSAIDDAAIKELRRAKLVWSGWGIVPPIIEPIGPFLPDHGLRIVEEIDQEAIWLFFWSIAWRASVSKIADMQHFQLPDTVERMARHAIMQQSISCLELPVSLIQLSTKGEAHNHSPIIDKKSKPNLDGKNQKQVPFARIYVDGLVAHLEFSPKSNTKDGNISIWLGDRPSVAVSTISYEASFQYQNILNIAYESYFGPLSESA